jgi:S1-C subfamily serine protease
MSTRRRRAVRIAKPVLGAAAAVALLAGTLSSDSVAAGFRAPTADEDRVACAIDPVLVEITTTLSPPARGRVWGSGVVINADGDILTNNHVVAGAASISVRISQRDYRATVAATDLRDDLALVRAAGAADLPVVTWGDSAALGVGQAVYAVGNGKGDCATPRATRGTIGALSRRTVIADELNGDSLRLSGLILSRVAVEPGYSGGALVNDRSEVVGILVAGHGEQPCDCYDRAFAIPSNKARAIATEMQAGRGSAAVHIGGTASLGVAAASSVSASVATYLTGALITYLVPGSAAERLGLHLGEQIVSIGGRGVHSALELAEVLQTYRPGERVELAWIDGDGQSRSASAVLGSGPPQ